MGKNKHDSDFATNQFFDGLEEDLKADTTVTPEAAQPQVSWLDLYATITAGVKDKLKFEIEAARAADLLDDRGKAALSSALSRIQGILELDFTKPLQLIPPGEDKVLRRVTFEYTEEDGKWLDENCKHLWGESRVIYLSDFQAVRVFSKSARAAGTSLDIPAALFEYGPKEEGQQTGRYIWFWNLAKTRKVSKKPVKSAPAAKPQAKTEEPDSPSVPAVPS
ncbi:MAG: hypothetical protein D0530_10905 [Methylococcales bacterium]|nr:MAG: hypothetical protein D0530_10905 [Methylococcales bacterium]